MAKKGYVLLLFCSLFELTIGQFPRLCIQNISLPDSTCCPIPPGLESPCGGHGIGTCKTLAQGPDYKPPAIPDWLEDDPRLDWPRRYFKSVCECHGNRDGFMCHLCKFGFYGNNCEKKKPLLIRRNALRLDSEERQTLVDTFNCAKYAPSDYASIVNGFGIEDRRFVNMTVWDYLVHVHYMATKNPMIGNKSICLDEKGVFSGSFKTLDFGHNGPGFMTWHRLFLMLMERELSRIAGDPFFALPYWQWAGGGTDCAVCTDDLAGATNWTDPSRKLRNESPFSEWKAVCQLINRTDNCTVYPCDLSQPTSHLIREPVTEESPTLPRISDVIYALNKPIFDLYPYDPSSSQKSARNCIEGYAGVYGVYRDTRITSTHVQIHSFFKGQISQVSSSPDDPLFFFHHTYVDKIFEMWLRLHNGTYKVFPRHVAAGHNLLDYIVPVLPLYRHIDFFRSSVEVGYDYDDEIEVQWVKDQNSILQLQATTDNGFSLRKPTVISITITTVTIFAIVIIVVIFNKRKLTQKTERSSIEEEEPLIL